MSTNGSPELLIVIGAGATAEQTEHVVARLQEAGIPVVERIDEIPTTVKAKIGERAGAKA